MKKKTWWGLGASLLLICISLGLAWQLGLSGKNLVSAATGEADSGKNKSMRAESQARPVDVVYPRPIMEGTAIVLPGKAEAARQATLFFRVSAPLVKVHASPGHRVKKGDLLLELDGRDYQRQVRVMESKLAAARATLKKMETGARTEDVHIIESSLAAARADLKLAKKELHRYDMLYKSQAVTEQIYDKAQTAVQGLTAKTNALEQQLARDTKGAREEDLAATRASIEELRARLDIARDQLGDTRLYAPFDGVVTKRLPEAHEMVRQGEPVMALDDISRIDIRVDVPENQVHRFLEKDNPMKYSAFFLTRKNIEYPADLSEYSARADAATGTYEFIFTVTPKTGDLIFPGMTAEIRLTADSTSGRPVGLAIPFQSLFSITGNTARVFRVDPATDQAVRQEITFESLAGGNDVKVLSGLSSGDLVVAGGSAFIRQGEALSYNTPKRTIN